MPSCRLCFEQLSIEEPELVAEDTLRRIYAEAEEEVSARTAELERSSSGGGPKGEPRDRSGKELSRTSEGRLEEGWEEVEVLKDKEQLEPAPQQPQSQERRQSVTARDRLKSGASASRKLRSVSFVNAGVEAGEARGDGVGMVGASAKSSKSVAGADERFVAEPDWLVTGRPIDAARGLNHYLRVEDSELHERLVYGVEAIRREIADGGTDEDQECLQYILSEAAGSSPKVFPNGVRDEGRCGETFAEFVNHPHSKMSGLSEGHVLALRLYSSAAYKSLNKPLRDQHSGLPHPFPVTIHLLAEGIKRLRTVMAGEDGANEVRFLWRGMRDVRVTDDFTSMGGTEARAASTRTCEICRLPPVKQPLLPPGESNQA